MAAGQPQRRINGIRPGSTGAYGVVVLAATPTGIARITAFGDPI
jgi:hypothetical protein